jgi:predicted adenine nucleotide alpha hydrolase (AANH) superfamily ATPase
MIFMVNQVNNTSVKLKRFMTISVLTNNLKNSNTEYSVKSYQLKNNLTIFHQNICGIRNKT